MILCLRGHSFRYEMENICRLFLPQEKIMVVSELPQPADGVVALTDVYHTQAGTRLSAKLMLNDWQDSAEETLLGDANREDFQKDCERRLAVLLYTLFVKLFGISMPWGAVTGVRPVKLMRRMSEQLGEPAAVEWFEKELLVTPEKAALCQRTLQTENALLSLSRPDSFSLYLSIPFCPTRCDYCSFVSHTVERAAKLIPAYVDNLCREIVLTGQIVKQLGLRLETVYMGGGTPTTLSAPQLTAIFQAVEQSFDLSHLREYTVEAGRPDTVTRDKMMAIRSAGISRVSINPQTLSDEVLHTIGRRHTARQFYDAFELARQCGLNNINTDLIAGLPGDDAESFERTLDGIIDLSPENITVHTLCMKRASNLVVHHREEYDGGVQTARMVECSIRRLTEQGYHPYYLYRQSRAVGNTENIGWSKPGMDGLYNVYIMDETHTILACGAGAVTKLKQPGGERIERLFNYKFPYEYNSRFADIEERKRQVASIYDILLQKDSQAK